MPRCPFATWKPISGSSGTHTGGPFKIVHHTTEGSTAQGAFNAFRVNRSDPHFTVDATSIFQHIDTSEAGRALRNAAGGVQTNRDSAIQIEVVGFAHRPKTRATLENVRKLCRWIERTHDIPRVWPNGFPKPATASGRDPGGHNRNAANWDSQSGHYGHSNVPENTHWDPAYSATEVEFLMDVRENVEGIDQYESIILEDPGLASDHSHMPDHAGPYGSEMELVAPARKRPAKRKAGKKPKARKPARAAAAKRKAPAKRKPAAKRKQPAKRKAAKKAKPQRARGRTRR
jgi:hypothetical protein